MGHLIKDYLRYLPEVINICDHLRSTGTEFLTTKDVFGGTDIAEQLGEGTRNYWYCFSPRYMANYKPLVRAIKVLSFLGISDLDNAHTTLDQYLVDLGNARITSNKTEFFSRIDWVKNTLKPSITDITDRISRLEKEEVDRLNEALHCHLENCDLSSVAMAVSAVERRLFRLMTKVRPEEVESLRDRTLGQLIGEYLKNKSSYQNIVPERHHDLLNLCNRYRVSAVHPIEEEVSRRIATSILNLTFEFLMDKDVAV